MRARAQWKRGEVKDDRCVHYSNGRCSGRGHKQPCIGGIRVCKVGKIVTGLFFEILGEGATFEEAFVDAEKREEWDRQRLHAMKHAADGGAR